MRRRILLADDSVTIQKVIELTFLDEDYEVKPVSNGDEAIALLSELDPDFVIADVHMPGANGYEVCRRAKQNRPDVPVLLLVGTFEPFDEGQMRSAGADSYLKKPFDSQELLQRVEELLAARPVSAPAAPAFAPEPPPPVFDLPLPGYDAPGGFASPAPAPELSAEAAWGSFDLTAEPAPPPFSAPAVPEPFDREPSFELSPEPEPAFSFQPEEPVFALDDGEVSFGLKEELRAPEELSLDEPFDGHVLSEPEPEPLRPAAGFAWSPAPPEMPAPPEEPQPTWSAEPAPEPLPWSEPAAPAFEPVEPVRVEEPAPWSAPAAASVTAAAFVTAAAPAAVEAPDRGANGSGRLSDEDVDRIARRLAELLGDRAIRDIAWEVIPDMAEVIIRDRLRELEGQADVQ